MYSYNLKNHVTEYYNGSSFVYFYVEAIDYDKSEIVITISDSGRIYRKTFDLFTDKNGDVYFEYGYAYKKIYIKDFEVV